MFAAKLTRAAHRATASPSTPAAAISTCTAHHSSRPNGHQRRHSSSKTSSSWPPSDNSTGKPAPAAKAAETGEPRTARTPVSAPKVSQKATKGRARGGYKRVGQVSEAKKSNEPVDQYAALPSVPSLHSMRVEDLTLSRFFSLHRPVSLTTTIPPPSTPESFSSLFTNRQHADPWANGNSAEGRPEDVIYTLHNTIDALENGGRQSEDEGVRWEIIHESPSNANEAGGVKHLDGAAPTRIKSLDELVAQFRPFKAPPPPQPFTTEMSGEQSLQQLAGSAEKKAVGARGRPRKKTFTATITVTESTYADGVKTYSASSSPIVRLPDAAADTSSSSATSSTQSAKLSFRARMAQRRQAQFNTLATRIREPTSSQSTTPMMPVRRAPSIGRQERMRKMWMISVKRQRKLKMKKHKYKKLMKRTRNLRRRLDRT